MGKHSAERRSAMPLLVATAAVVAIAVVAFVFVRLLGGSAGSTAAASAPLGIVTTTSAPPTISSSSTTSSPTSTTTSATPTTPTTSAADVAARAALQSCLARQAAAKGLVDSIATGAGHWSDHVQGESELESGARTLIDVKTNTWGPTRAAGPADIAAFQAATAAYASAPACPTTPPQQTATADLTAKMQACATREQALDTVVGIGSQVMGDWGTHLSEMADHADGHVVGAQAQANWIKRYSEAPVHLTPYKAAASAYASAPACTV
ncbi:MAG: hypothetical protein ABIW80_04100 [Lapillicoccus sp.]